MTKIFKRKSTAVLLGILLIPAFFYVRYLNLDNYTLSTDNRRIMLGEKQYKYDESKSSLDFDLEKKIGKVKQEDVTYMVWSIKGVSSEERIAIIGFMYPAESFIRVK